MAKPYLLYTKCDTTATELYIDRAVFLSILMPVFMLSSKSDKRRLVRRRETYHNFRTPVRINQIPCSCDSISVGIRYYVVALTQPQSQDAIQATKQAHIKLCVLRFAATIGRLIQGPQSWLKFTLQERKVG
jgi:hypothetical protein